jgi:plastocyanin
MVPLVALFAVAALAADQSVTASGTQFSPDAVTINRGEKVTWTNQDGQHNVKFDDGSFEQPTNAVDTRWTVERTFSAPGTFGYYCELHGSSTNGMRGTVTVLEAVPPPGGDSSGGVPGGTPSGGTPPGGTPPGGTPPGTPTAPAPPFKVTLRLSDSTPRPGRLVRFLGSVEPARDGGLVRIQRRTRKGSYRTVAKAELRDAGDARSKYSRKLRISGDGVFRARVPGDDDRATGTSPIRRLSVEER